MSGGATYEIWLNDQFGNRITQIAGYTQLTWMRTLNDRGTFSIMLSPDVFNHRLYDVDRRVEIWRYPEDRPPQLILVGFLRRIRRGRTGEQRWIQISGWDTVDLLQRRVLYYTDPSDAYISSTADQAMKTLVRDHLGSSAGAGRDLSAYFFEVQANTTEGAATQSNGSNQTLLRVLQDISQASAEQLNAASEIKRIYFDVVPRNAKYLEFRTYAGVRGSDRTIGQPLVFSVESRTLANPVIDEDASDEITHVYVAGLGVAPNWNIQSVSSARASRSAFNRREAFVSAGREGTVSNVLTDVGNAVLRANRPRKSFTADVINANDNQFGIHWGFGDRVFAEFEAERFTCDIQTVACSFSNGQELIQARLEYVG